MHIILEKNWDKEYYFSWPRRSVSYDKLYVLIKRQEFVIHMCFSCQETKSQLQKHKILIEEIRFWSNISMFKIICCFIATKMSFMISLKKIFQNSATWIICRRKLHLELISSKNEKYKINKIILKFELKNVIVPFLSFVCFAFSEIHSYKFNLRFLLAYFFSAHTHIA